MISNSFSIPWKRKRWKCSTWSPMWWCMTWKTKKSYRKPHWSQKMHSRLSPRSLRMVNGFISVRPRPRRCRRIMIRYVIISVVLRSIRIVARSASRSIRWYMRIAWAIHFPVSLPMDVSWCTRKPLMGSSLFGTRMRRSGWWIWRIGQRWICLRWIARIRIAIILGVVIVIGSYLVAAGITVYILYLIFVI